MILADTSAWVEFLRETGSRANVHLRECLGDGELATTDVVLMEVLAGARDETHLRRLRRLQGACELLATEGPGDYEAAAGLYRSCRRGGETVRTLTDCLVAAVAVRHGVALLHADTDFHVLERHTALEVA
ncbi:MAG: type II toxin-antitoxin system VapC family toxin [Actinomycetes bacterium]